MNWRSVRGVPYLSLQDPTTLQMISMIDNGWVDISQSYKRAGLELIHPRSLCHGGLATRSKSDVGSDCLKKIVFFTQFNVVQKRQWSAFRV